MNNNEENYYLGLVDFALLAKEYGTKTILEDLRDSYPDIYNQIVIHMTAKQEQKKAKLLGG